MRETVKKAMRQGKFVSLLGDRGKCRRSSSQREQRIGRGAAACRVFMHILIQWPRPKTAGPDKCSIAVSIACQPPRWLMAPEQQEAQKLHATCSTEAVEKSKFTGFMLGEETVLVGESLNLVHCKGRRTSLVVSRGAKQLHYAQF